MTALGSMVRVHRWVLEEKRRKLADIEVFLNKLKEELTTLDQDLEDEREAASRSGDASLAYPTFVAAALERRRKLCDTITNLEKEVELARREVAEAFGELKTFETAQQNQDAQESAKRNRRDRLNLDELAVSIYRRNRAAGEGS